MDDDRKTPRRLGGVALTGLWLAAAAVAVGVGFGAVRLVGDKVTDEIPAPLSAGRVADVSATPGAPVASPSTRPSPPASAPRGTTTPARPAPGPARTRPAEDRNPTSPARRTTSTRTVLVTGGTVAVRCTGNSVGLLYARPDDGYASKVGSRGPAEVEVEFESTADRGGSGRVKARCSGGTASVETRNR
ncbi:MAG: hypothetical protein QOC93_1903 [Actinomycetota bacterium]|nr:hypothetical protein [Actinomycetota bacterium]